MTVDPGLNVAIEDERHELLLHRGHRRVEAAGHQLQVGGQIRAEVLDKALAPEKREGRNKE